MTSNFKFPSSLDWLSDTEWYRTLPETLNSALKRWELTPGDFFQSGNVSFVTRVKRDEGDAVLKIQWPHDECEFEADALQVWDGDGAVRLLAKHENILLLEFADPGLLLADVPNLDVVPILAGILRRHWQHDPSAVPFRTLETQAGAWIDSLINEPEAYCAEFGPVALRYLDDLAKTQRSSVLLHQDLHGHNVVSAQREPWLVIDPKPLVGEREFSVAPIVRSSEFGHCKREVIGRLDSLCDALQLDRERARKWTVAQSVVWSRGSDFEDRHLEVVRWLEGFS